MASNYDRYSVQPIQLVIFDCDGVLVDSEPLAARVGRELLAEHGWQLSQEEVVDRFVGRSEEYMHAEVEAVVGSPLPDWPEEFRNRLFSTYRSELKAVAGITEALGGITLPCCVASSGTHEKMDVTLAVTGLLPRFAGHIYSAEEVPRAKPAPDVFLHAAASEGFPPFRCVVVEDSRAGVTAARAAGMRVLAYTSSVTPAEQLSGHETTLFADMKELPDLINDLSLIDN